MRFRMGDNRVWVRDIELLRKLGRHGFGDLANDLSGSKAKISVLDLNPAAFGENPIRVEMEKAYENARAQFGKQLSFAFEGLKDSGEAIVKAADHYRAIEDKLSS
ncbi:hypothetical protein [Actinomadura craniellae]|uniref:hypothetical protein n=1 Tax=Actinomadura craniellae TaxID=2231787 RepID=UPI0011BF09E0|nr:hypothetical protein [Actinomadura craniellae]